MIHLRTFGTPDLRGEDGREIRSVLSQPKRFALLVYLHLAASGGPHRRERLLSLFWPHLDGAHGRNSLSQALSTLRRGLGSNVLVTRGDEEVGVAPSRIECDALTFERAAAEGRAEDALGHYTGDFLRGLELEDVAPEFARWMEDERTRLRTLALRAAMGLAVRAEQGGDILRAVEWASRGRSIAPRDDAPVEALVRLLETSGDPSGALAAYEEHAASLARELGVEPAAELQRLAEEVRSRAVGIRSAPGPAVASGSGAGIAVPRAAVSPHPGQGERVLAGTEREGSAPAGDLARTPRPRWRRSAAVGAAGLLTAIALFVTIGVPRLLGRGEDPPISRAVAVLPFADLCPGAESRSFVGGMHAEMATHLSGVADLQVASLAAVQRYAAGSMAGREIGKELGVGTLLTGTVQCAGSRIRVSVQLVDAASDRNLWAETYDREREDLFAIQTDIAQAVVENLHAELTPGERSTMAQPPSRSGEAYEVYLRAREYHRRHPFEEDDARAAEALYGRALELDPTFALAYARLALLHGHIYRIGWDRSAGRQASWRLASERALRLQPDLPEAHLARAAYWRGQQQLERALREVRIALERLPNDPDARALLAEIHCRQGRWDSCLEEARRAVRLDSHAASHQEQLAFTLWYMHRYPEAARAYDRVLELAPDNHSARLYRGRLYADWFGTTDSLAAAVRSLPPEWNPHGISTTNRLLLARLQRRPRDVLAAIAGTDRRNFSHWRYEVPFSLLQGEAYEDVGEADLARISYRNALVSLEALVREQPAAGIRRALLAWALTGLDREEDALREISLARELEPLEGDAIEGAAVLEFSAHVLTRLGEIDAALGEVEGLLANPSPISVVRLRREARWDPLRADPRFEALLRRYERASSDFPPIR